MCFTESNTAILLPVFRASLENVIHKKDTHRKKIATVFFNCSSYLLLLFHFFVLRNSPEITTVIVFSTTMFHFRLSQHRLCYFRWTGTIMSACEWNCMDARRVSTKRFRFFLLYMLKQKQTNKIQNKLLDITLFVIKILRKGN